MKRDKLFTRSYICILAANFLLFFGFWLLIPILPFYLQENYHCPEAMLGLILSCYTVSGLCIRPFSGFLMDKFPRKPIYILCYFTCVCMFLGYMLAATLAWFVLLRALHGVAFGSVTVGGNTLCVDIMPSSRRGEGLGYYGLTNNTAMALGPMTGLFMHSHISYTGIFLTAMIVSLCGLMCACAVKARMPESMRKRMEAEKSGAPLPESMSAPKRKVSLDRFILLKGIPVSISLLLLSIPYGATTNFVAMYAGEIHITAPSGFFFTLMAIGMGVSRLFAGRLVDKGYITQCIHYGYYPVIVAFFCLGSCRFMAMADMTLAHGSVLHRAGDARHWLRRDVPGHELAIRQPGPKQPEGHCHEHIPHRMGRRHRHRHTVERIHRTCVHVLHGLPFGGCAMRDIHGFLREKGNTPLQHEQT